MNARPEIPSYVNARILSDRTREARTNRDQHAWDWEISYTLADSSPGGSLGRAYSLHDALDRVCQVLNSLPTHATEIDGKVDLMGALDFRVTERRRLFTVATIKDQVFLWGAPMAEGTSLP